MKCTYEGELFKVPIFSRMMISITRTHLKIIRGWRFFCRLPFFLKPLGIVLICLIIYILVIYFINYENKYQSIISPIWDTRNTIFSVLILTGFVTISSKQKEYHQALLKRHEKYTEAMLEYDNHINSIVKILSVDKPQNFILYSKPTLKYFINSWNSIDNSTSSFEAYQENIQAITKSIRSIRSYTKFLLDNIRFLPYWENRTKRQQYFLISVRCISNCLEVLRILTRNLGSQSLAEFHEFQKKFKPIVYSIFEIVEYYRYPWRIDEKLDYKIAKIIHRKGKGDGLPQYPSLRFFGVENPD